MIHLNPHYQWALFQDIPGGLEQATVGHINLHYYYSYRLHHCPSNTPSQCSPFTANQSIFFMSYLSYLPLSIQCFDTVGWATEEHPACKKTGCWVGVGGQE